MCAHTRMVGAHGIMPNAHTISFGTPAQQPGQAVVLCVGCARFGSVGSHAAHVRMGLVVVQGIAVGAAYKGLKPVVEFMTWNFCMQVGLSRRWCRCGRVPLW